MGGLSVKTPQVRCRWLALAGSGWLWLALAGSSWLGLAWAGLAGLGSAGLGPAGLGPAGSGWLAWVRLARAQLARAGCLGPDQFQFGFLCGLPSGSFSVPFLVPCVDYVQNPLCDSLLYT